MIFSQGGEGQRRPLAGARIETAQVCEHIHDALVMGVGRSPKEIRRHELSDRTENIILVGGNPLLDEGCKPGNDILMHGGCESRLMAKEVLDAADGGPGRPGDHREGGFLIAMLREQFARGLEDFRPL
jgi:hypothetical protein